MIVSKNSEGDFVCEHGTAIDIHCCNCHSGFLFDINSCVCEFEIPPKVATASIYHLIELKIAKQ